MIVGFSPVEEVQGNTGSVRVATLFIANERKFVMDVTLWGEFIDKFDIPAIAAKSADGPIVVACNGLQLREYQSGASKLSLEHASTLMDQFLKLLPSGQIVPPIFTDAAGSAACIAQLVVPPAPRAPARRLKLSELAAIDGRPSLEMYECVVRITDVLTRHDWSYPSCPSCFFKVNPSEQRSICENETCSFHKSRVNPVPWYRFTIRV